MIRSRIALLAGALVLTGFTGDADDASARQPQSALYRSPGSDSSPSESVRRRSPTVVRRVADLIVDTFGTEAGKVDGVCGHREIETALVELYRETGAESYLERACYFVDRRGHGLLGDGRFGRHYWQDHLPVRDAASVEGHAVRQLYLLVGVADVYLETGDASLLEALKRLWAEMVATKTYLTGGIGAHHSDEAFGDPYELPNERSYSETCAAIASIMFCWRMLMITGEAKYADLMERTLYNGVPGWPVTGRAALHLRQPAAGPRGPNRPRR